MIKRLQRLRAATFLGLALLGASFAVQAQTTSALKEAAKSAKVSPDLYTVITNGGITQQVTPEGLERLNLFMTLGNTIAIDAVANSEGDGQALLQALQSLGLSKGIVSKQRVSGYLPVDKLGELKNIGVLKFARPAYKPMKNVGAVTSQGDVAMRADVARTTYSVSGAGVKVGVLSDSYNNLGGAASGVSTGDLPAGVQVLADLTDGSGSDEGRAMIELIHDVAPGSPQAFHTAFEGDLDFAQGIRDLAAAGCKIITDDIFYFAEPFFQDGPIAQAVDEVVGNGITYFSAAGNAARNSYQSAYSPTTPPTNPTYEIGAHNFGGGDKFQSLTLTTGQQVIISFQWDNPFFSVSGGAGAQTDMDLLVYVGGVFQGSLSGVEFNIGGDPVEVIGLNYGGATPIVVELVLAKYQGPDPTLIKWVNFGSTVPVEYNTRSSTSVGHNNSARGIGTGAAPFFNTPAFNGALTTAIIENFSSAGGTPILFNTAGARLGTPIVRQKPDITAVDGTNTTFFVADSPRDTDTFPNFFGTSAAAPHAAAVAALMKEKVPTITPATILSTLQSTALDMDDPFTAGFDTGFDFGTGFGFIQADRALQAISPAPNGAPTVANAISPQSATVGQAFTFTIPANTFADPNSDALTLSVSGLPMGLSFTAPATISGTPSVTGVSMVTVTATDPGSLSVSTTFTLTVNPASMVPPVPGTFAITGATPVTCATVTAGERMLTFSPQYTGLNGQPVSFSVANELSPTTASGPYTLRLYTDNPTITLKATQAGTAGEASFAYNWLASCGAGTPPPPTPGTFSISGVIGVSCTRVTASERTLTFSPQYMGLNGQPVTFSVQNELSPTTSAGPYTLRLYTDNPSITLKATQSGTAGEVSFVYNWLAACGSARLGAGVEPTAVLKATLYPNPVGEEFGVRVEGAQGQTVRFLLSDVTGRSLVTKSVEVNSNRHDERLRLNQAGTGMYLLRVSTAGQAVTLKVIKQ